MTNLSVNARWAMIYLSQAHITDCCGRLGTYTGSLPTIPGLSGFQQTNVTKSLLAGELILKYRSSAKSALQCWEVAGAYNFKAGVKSAIETRLKTAKKKSADRGKANNKRRETAKAGLSYLSEDDGSTDVEVVKPDLLMNSKGELARLRPQEFFTRAVPAPDPKKSFDFLYPMPDTAAECNLRMFPSFDVYEGLTPLGACIRFFLEMHADSYGRVKLDEAALMLWFGRGVLKKISKDDVRSMIPLMVMEGHLLRHGSDADGLFYIRDSAQLLLKKMFYDNTIPRMKSDQTFAHTTERYMEFINHEKARKAAAARVLSHTMVEKCQITSVYVPVQVKAEDCLRDYDAMVKARAGWTLMQLCGLESAADSPHPSLYPIWAFWHALKNNLPLCFLEAIYEQHIVEFEDRPNDSEVMRFLLHGKTPDGYLEMRRHLEPKATLQEVTKLRQLRVIQGKEKPSHELETLKVMAAAQNQRGKTKHTSSDKKPEIAAGTQATATNHGAPGVPPVAVPELEPAAGKPDFFDDGGGEETEEEATERSEMARHRAEEQSAHSIAQIKAETAAGVD